MQLTDVEVEGSELGWLVVDLLPHVTKAPNSDDLVGDFDAPGDPEGDLELDEDGHAVFAYQTIDETAEVHRRGTLQTAVVPVGVVVERGEIDELQRVVRSLLTGGELGVAAPEVQATYTRLEPQLAQLLRPRAATRVTVTWHTPPEPDEDELTDDGGECGDGCAASNGDPHLVPVAGDDYDFQSAGEFTLLRSGDGETEIQARQEPAGDSDTVAITTAVAVLVAGRRVVIELDDDGRVALRVDSEQVDLVDELDLGNGGVLAPHERGVEIDFPDGTTMWTIAQGSAGIQIVVSPSDGLRATGVGLLGPNVADALPLDAQELFDAVHGELAAAWRVTADSSLFDYAPGESTETFDVLGFPSRPLTYDDLTPEQLALGEEACADVAPELLFLQCVFDVGATGDVAYAEGYATIRRVIEQAGTGLGRPGRSSPPRPPPTRFRPERPTRSRSPHPRRPLPVGRWPNRGQGNQRSPSRVTWWRASPIKPSSPARSPT